jgi:hypothetical protein
MQLYGNSLATSNETVIWREYYIATIDYFDTHVVRYSATDIRGVAITIASNSV